MSQTKLEQAKQIFDEMTVKLNELGEGLSYAIAASDSQSQTSLASIFCPDADSARFIFAILLTALQQGSKAPWPVITDMLLQARASAEAQSAGPAPKDPQEEYEEAQMLLSDAANSVMRFNENNSVVTAATIAATGAQVGSIGVKNTEDYFDLLAFVTDAGRVQLELSEAQIRELLDRVHQAMVHRIEEAGENPLPKS